MSMAPMMNDVSSPNRPELNLGRRPGRGRPTNQLRTQASTLREMLVALETFTAAGQRHTMEKIVAFLAEHVPTACRTLGRRNREALVRLVLSLRQESQRRAPDPVLFGKQAENIMVLMGALDQKRET